MRTYRRGRVLRAARHVLAWACVAAVAGLPTAASGQTATSDRAVPELEEARALLSRMQQYKSACEDLRNAGPDFRVPASSVLSVFKDDKLFLTAIGNYCASGTFALDGSLRQECKEKRKFTEQHMEFLRQLPVIRVDAPARVLRLECVELQGSLNMFHFESGGLFLKNVTAGRIFVALSRLPGGVKMENVTVANGIGLYALSVDAPIEIIETEIGNNGTWSLALGIVDSTVRSVLMARRTKIKGKLDLSGSKIGGGLVISDVRVDGDVVLNYLRADRVRLSKGTFAQVVNAEHAHIEKQFLINAATEITGDFQGEHLHAADFRVEDAKLSKGFTLSRAKIGTLRFTNVSTVDPNCSQCNLRLWDATVLHLGYRGSLGMNILAGNGRFHTFIASGGAIPRFDCSDCLVEQYMLLASKMTGRTSLAGADIKGTLAFSEGNHRACWAAPAVLDLSELRTDVISANASDLVQLSQPAPDKSDCTNASQPVSQGAALVPTLLTGARYRAITPGRQYDSASAPPKSKPVPLVGLPSARLVELIKSGRTAGHSDGYDPQPYEELAEALTRAGETGKARELRIAKIDDRLASTEIGLVRRAFYWSYRLISRYGFENERAAWIFGGLLAIGMAIHLYGRKDALFKFASRRASAPLGGLLAYSLWFSLDRAIPPLHLDPHMHEKRGENWLVQHYFYLHRVLGTYLISVFAAGAAGFGH
jgi:hypothetical protein